MRKDVDPDNAAGAKAARRIAEAEAEVADRLAGLSGSALRAEAARMRSEALDADSARRARADLVARAYAAPEKVPEMVRQLREGPGQVSGQDRPGGGIASGALIRQLEDIARAAGTDKTD